MGIDLTTLYRQKRLLMARWRKQAREGLLEAAVLPLIPRNPTDITENDELNGDTDQPSGVWLTSLPDTSLGTKGGAVSMSTLSTGSEHLTFRPNAFRLSTLAEIDGEQKRQQALLDGRIAGARRLSVREDSKYGKLQG